MNLKVPAPIIKNVLVGGPRMVLTSAGALSLPFHEALHFTIELLRRRAVRWSISILWFLTLATATPTLHAAVGGSPFYEYKVVAKHGTEIGAGWFITDNCLDAASGQLDEIGERLSINDKGLIAFPAKLLETVNPPFPGFVEGALVIADPTWGELTRAYDQDLLWDACIGQGWYDIQINNDDKLIAEDVGGIWVIDTQGHQWDCSAVPLMLPLPRDTLPRFANCWDLVNGVLGPRTPSRADDGTVAFVAHRQEQPWGLFISVGGVPRQIAVASSNTLSDCSLGWPMVANGGVVVVHDGFGAAQGDILLFEADGTRRVLASTASGFSQVGDYPGITSDGKAVVFFASDANRKAGLYLYLNDEILNPGHVSHLLLSSDTIGVNNSGGEINFHDLEFSNAVCVVRQDVANDGQLDGDSLVVAFMATPAEASRDNPALPDHPLLFSETNGIWTCKVDIQRGFKDRAHYFANVSTILPVLQVGAQVDGETVTNLTLWRGLGTGTREVNGSTRQTLEVTRPMPGDHFLAFRVETTGGPMVLFAAKLDSDGDGLMDHWERPGGGIDMDGDGVPDLDLAALGASPYHKDLFLEVDWLSPRTIGFPMPWSNEPQPGALTSLVAMFQNAPVWNVDGGPGITLHIDAGHGTDVAGNPFSQNFGAADNPLLHGGEVVPSADHRPDVVYMGDVLDPATIAAYPALKFAHFEDIKEASFGDDREKFARELSFRYALLADFSEARLSIPSPLGDQPLKISSALAGNLVCTNNFDPDGDGSPNITIIPGDAIVILTGPAVGQIRTISSITLPVTGAPGIVLNSVPPWTTIPLPGDQFAVLSGSTGRAEEDIAPDNALLPDLDPHSSGKNNNGFPGNDLVITLGASGPGAGSRLGTADMLWRTMAHELGHTLGLNHGGNDPNCPFTGDVHLSLMSYTHHLRLSATNCLKLGPCPGDVSSGCTPPPPDFAALSPVPGVVVSFSGGTDLLGVNEWDYLKMAPYATPWFVGNTRLKYRGTVPPGEPGRYITPLDLQPKDLRPPVVSILAPAAPSSVAAGGTLTVRLSIQDESALRRVSVKFDLNGDGKTDSPGENLGASAQGGGIYQATFTSVSGPTGPRPLQVEAEDVCGNLAILTPNVMVGGFVSDYTPPEVVLRSPPTTPGVPIPVQLGSWLQIEVEAKDYDYSTFQYVPADYVTVRFDIDGDGDTTGPGETVVATHTVSNSFVAFFPNISGPTGLRNLQVRAVDKWLNVADYPSHSYQVRVILPDNVPPTVSFVSPAEGATVAVRHNLDVKVKATDDQGIQDVKIRFDANGDGTNEEFTAFLADLNGTYLATLLGISGPLGPRTLTAVAHDLAGNEGLATRSVNVAVVDLAPPTAYFIAPQEGVYVSTNTTLLVTFGGNDDDVVAAMTVSFDIDGDGQTNGPGETVVFTGLSTSYYLGTATFDNVRGGFGPRTIAVTATDASGKTNTAQRTVNVSSPLTISNPKPGDRVPTASTLVVQFTAATAVDLTSLIVRFDTNGDGDTSDPGEAVHPVGALTPNTWTASFSNIDGPPGPRQVFVDGRLTGGTTQTVNVTIEVIDNGATPVNWVSLNPGLPGTEGPVYALARDGRGNVYVGGFFAVAGTVMANNVAKWDGSAWSPLGQGLPDPRGGVYALAFDGANLYAGGYFGVAKWDGSTWALLHAPGSVYPGPVRALAISGTDLYAGGDFTQIGTVYTTGMAKWNGNTWSALGSGMNNYVYALAASGSDLYAGGRFTTAGGTSANFIAKWDGTSWSPLGAGMTTWVGALTASGTDLYVIGVSGVTKWNGSAWSSVGGTEVIGANVILADRSDIYAAGNFSSGGVLAYGIKKWNGSGWVAVGSWLPPGNLNEPPTFFALALNGSDVYIGGAFTTTVGLGAKYIARWNGGAWSALGSGMDAPVLAMAMSGTDLYAGGWFNTGSNVLASRIANWDGSTWSALGSGTLGSSTNGTAYNNSISALAASGTNLYVGGTFASAGGVPVSNIAQWDGVTWSTLGTGLSGGLGRVLALAVSSNILYAAGDFNTAGGVSALNIAKWSGISWSALGAGLAGNVQALAVIGADLYAGGNFVGTGAGGVRLNSIAKWNGGAWEALGTGMDQLGTVKALAVIGTDLYVGGHFYMPGGAPALNVAKWDGIAWSALGSGIDGDVYALAVSGHDLYAAGRFSIAGGVPVNRIAKWNGIAWSPCGSGILGRGGSYYPDAWDGSADHIPYALAADASGHLFIGGVFGFAGTNLSPYIVEADVGGSVSCACALSATYSAGTVTISWPCFSNGCILEAADQLLEPPLATVWTPVSPQPTSGSYTEAVTGARRYFRLRAP